MHFAHGAIYVFLRFSEETAIICPQTTLSVWWRRSVFSVKYHISF
jgi:hypothetical protein